MRVRKIALAWAAIGALVLGVHPVLADSKADAEWQLQPHATKPWIVEQAPLSAKPRVVKEDGPIAIHLLQNHLITHVMYQDMPNEQKFRQLENWCNTIINDQARMLDGRWYIDAYRNAFDVYAKRRTTHPQKWEGDLAFMQAWSAAYPNSRCAPVIEADIWMQYAWHARGPGYAHTVTEEGWRLFYERCRVADAILDRHASVAQFNPSWYTSKVQVGLGLQGPINDVLAVLAAGLQTFPGYFQSIFAMTRHFLPKWGGDWKILDEFVESIVKYVSQDQKDIYYARIYLNIYAENPDLRKQGIPNWGRMRTGFEAMLKAYPQSYWGVNLFAAYACAAQDEKAYVELRPKLAGEHYFANAFPKPLSLDVCDARFKVWQPL